MLLSQQENRSQKSLLFNLDGYSKLRVELYFAETPILQTPRPLVVRGLK